MQIAGSAVMQISATELGQLLEMLRCYAASAGHCSIAQRAGVAAQVMRDAAPQPVVTARGTSLLHLQHEAYDRIQRRRLGIDTD